MEILVFIFMLFIFLTIVIICLNNIIHCTLPVQNAKEWPQVPGALGLWPGDWHH